MKVLLFCVASGKTIHHIRFNENDIMSDNKNLVEGVFFVVVILILVFENNLEFTEKNI